MPHKYNADRRHRIPRTRYKVTNWRDYEAGLRKRGSLTIWFSEEAIAAWRAAPRTTPGGQARYSDLAIETTLILRTVFHQPLRQTEGLVGSLLELMELDLPVPDHSTLSRRSRTLTMAPPVRTASGPVHLLVDSTGVKLSGPGEWLVEKHGTQRRRAWRKLHLAVDAKTGTIVASARATAAGGLALPERARCYPGSGRDPRCGWRAHGRLTPRPVRPPQQACGIPHRAPSRPRRSGPACWPAPPPRR
jgi:hypothetical protein